MNAREIVSRNIARLLEHDGRTLADYARAADHALPGRGEAAWRKALQRCFESGWPREPDTAEALAKIFGIDLAALYTAGAVPKTLVFDETPSVETVISFTVSVDCVERIDDSSTIGRLLRISQARLDTLTLFDIQRRIERAFRKWIDREITSAWSPRGE